MKEWFWLLCWFTVFEYSPLHSYSSGQFTTRNQNIKTSLKDFSKNNNLVDSYSAVIFKMHSFHESYGLTWADCSNRAVKYFYTLDLMVFRVPTASDNNVDTSLTFEIWCEMGCAVSGKDVHSAELGPGLLLQSPDVTGTALNATEVNTWHALG